MALTPWTLAFDIINRGRVNACKYEPREQEANAVGLFLGRKPGHETFISEPQYNLFKKLLNGGTIITTGQGEERFGAFIKSVWSAAKQKSFYLLVFGGYVPQDEPAPQVSAPAPTPPAPVKAAQPVPSKPAPPPGKLIPLDMDIPF